MLVRPHPTQAPAPISLSKLISQSDITERLGQADPADGFSSVYSSESPLLLL